MSTGLTKVYESDLSKAGLSKNEVSAVIKNIGILIEKGVSKSDIDTVVDKIAKDPTFKEGFIRDPNVIKTVLVGKFGDVTF